MTPSTTPTETRVTRGLLIAAFVLGGFLIAVLVTSLAGGDPSPYDTSLPNPMGGPARTAPGTTSGELDLAGLTVEGTTVEMGDVVLGVTYVPRWEVSNPGAEPAELTVGQPQVLEGCCPGPVYADGTLIEPGQTVLVPAGESLRLEFPLQMHAGMDGPHHLLVPVSVGDEVGALHVTGDFGA